MTEHSAENDALALLIERAISTMPVRNRSEAEAVAWLLVNTPVVAYVAAAIRGEYVIPPGEGNHDA
jgi:hypothetical protein